MSAEGFLQTEEFQVLKKTLIEIYRRKTPPECGDYLKLLEKINYLLENEDERLRPYDSSGLPGGIINLNHNIPTIIVPDIHARLNFFLNLMLYKDRDGHSILQKLARDIVQVVCVGDGFHAERRAAERWAAAFEEYKKKYRRHKNIDEEMRESLGVMEMVIEAKLAFPDNFHFLKGNHENISNEYGGGNYPFRKFSYEGAMVAEYVEKFYGRAFLDEYYMFEKNLPLLAIGRIFLISHAEPMSFYDREAVIEYRIRPEVVEGLTWTDNNDTEQGSVIRMLGYYLDGKSTAGCYYFGGHRPVRELYNLRAGGRYVQIHNPGKFIIAMIDADRDINLDEDVIEIKENLDNFI